MTWGTDWTSERKALVRRLWERGFTASQIAARVDVPVTRNAIIGLVHRNRWAKGLVPMKPRKPSPRKHEHRPRPRAPSPPRRKALPIGKLQIWDLLDRHCRWPAGDRPPFLYCGADAILNSSYCKEHHKRAHHT